MERKLTAEEELFLVQLIHTALRDPNPVPYEYEYTLWNAAGAFLCVSLLLCGLGLGGLV